MMGSHWLLGLLFIMLSCSHQEVWAGLPGDLGRHREQVGGPGEELLGELQTQI